jgi:transcriptional regulator of acetoin/glycerol metabolism
MDVVERLVTDLVGRGSRGTATAEPWPSLLDRTEGNVSQAARRACMTRSHLFDLLRKHNLR